MPKKLYSNEEFFNNKVKKAYYWAGFIAADSCVTKDNRLELALKLDDIEHVRSFKRAIEAEHEVSVSHQRKACRIRIRSEKIAKSLMDNFNIIPNKSKILEFPYIEEEYLLFEYIRGYIDGDGCLSVSKTENPLGLPNLIICSGSYSFLEEISDIFSLYTNNYNIPKYQSNVWKISYGRYDSLKILELVYNNSSVNTRLLRKYNIVKKFLGKGIVQ